MCNCIEIKDILLNKKIPFLEKKKSHRINEEASMYVHTITYKKRNRKIKSNGNTKLSIRIYILLTEFYVVKTKE